MTIQNNDIGRNARVIEVVQIVVTSISLVFQMEVFGGVGKTKKTLPAEVEEDIKLRFQEGQAILEDAGCAEAITTLFWLGCDPVRILQLLDAYCETDSDDSDQKPDELDVSVRSLSRRLQRDAERLERLELPPISPNLPGKMRKTSEGLSEIYKSWTESDMPRGAKVAFLVAAAEIVRTVAPRPHYPELADLVTFLKSKVNPTPSEFTEPGTLRVNVKHFRDRNEMPFLTPQEIQVEGLRGRKKWHALLRRLQKR